MSAAVPLAEAFIRIRPDNTAFVPELRKGMEPAAASAGTRSGRLFSENMRRNASAGLRGAGAAVGLSVFGGLAAVLKTGASEVSDYQKGLAQLQQGLKTTGGAAGLNAQQMEDLASSIQDYSGQTDDSVVAAEQLLITFTNIRNEAGKGNDVFTRTTKIAADMAARLGGDASTSAIQLGKALNDPVKGVTALSRVGVSFTEQQKKQIAGFVRHGQVVRAQKVILAELNKEFGGSAKAVGQTLPGQLAKARRSFEDLSQRVVTALLPTFNKLVSVIGKDVLPKMQAFFGFLSRNKAVILPVAAGLGTLAAGFFTGVKAVKLLTTTMGLFGKTLTISSGPVGLIIGGIALLAAGLIYAYGHSKTFRNIVQGTFRGVLAAAKAVGSFFTGPFLRAIGGLVSVSVKGFKFLADTWFTVVGGILHGAAAMLGWVPGLGGKLKGAVRAFDRLHHGVDAAMKGIIDSSSGWGRSVADGFAHGITAHEKKALAAAAHMGKITAAGLANAIRAASPSKLTYTHGRWFVEGFANGITGSLATVRTALSRMIATIKDSLATLRGDSASLVSNVASTLTGAADLSNAPNLSVGGVTNFLSSQLRADQTLQRNLALAAKRGLSSVAVQQIAAMGSGAGGVLAGNLAHASTAELRRINRLESGIARTAQGVGHVVARATYGPQLDRLSHQLDRLEKAIRSVGSDTARANAHAHSAGGTHTSRQGAHR